MKCLMTSFDHRTLGPGRGAHRCARDGVRSEASGSNATKVATDELEDAEERFARGSGILAHAAQALVICPAAFGVALTDASSILFSHRSGDLQENAATLEGPRIQNPIAAVATNDRSQRLAEWYGIENAAGETESTDRVDEMCRIAGQQDAADAESLDASIVHTIRIGRLRRGVTESRRE